MDGKNCTFHIHLLFGVVIFIYMLKEKPWQLDFHRDLGRLIQGLCGPIVTHDDWFSSVTEYYMLWDVSIWFLFTSMVEYHFEESWSR